MAELLYDVMTLWVYMLLDEVNVRVKMEIKLHSKPATEVMSMIVLSISISSWFINLWMASINKKTIMPHIKMILANAPKTSDR
jgi:hypothetical protein